MLGSIQHQKLSFFIIYVLEDEQELSLGMLIRLRRIYNFWLFHANIIQLSHILAPFYMIYWTNLLIQCPVPVPVLCMFFVSQSIHIKRSPNAIKFHGELFWTICEFWELESPQTEAHTGHKTPRHHPRARRMVVGCAHLVHWLELYFGRKEAYIRKKIVLKSQRNQSYGSLGI